MRFFGSKKPQAQEPFATQQVASLKITSSDFANGEFLPAKFSCEGEDAFPTLEIEGLPEETKALAILVEDPDAPVGVFVHLMAIVPFATGKIDEQVLEQSILGINDFGRIGW